MAIISFTTKFNRVLSTPQFIFTDTSNYTGQGIAESDVNGDIQSIIAPSGTIIYSNTIYTDIGCDIKVSSSRVNQIVIPLPLDSSGNAELGVYAITYKVFDKNLAVYYTVTNHYTYSYISPIVQIDQEVNCAAPSFISTDVTPYVFYSVTPAIVRQFIFSYPIGDDGNPLASPIEVDAPTLATGVFFTPGTHTTSLISTLTYTFPDGLIVIDEIEGRKEAQVNCTSICAIYCCIKSFYNIMIDQKTSNYEDYKKSRIVFSVIMATLELAEFAQNCSKYNDVAGYLTEIQKLTNCTSSCNCNDGQPMQVVGLGAQLFSTVVTASSPVVSTPSVSGNIRTYNISLLQTFIDKVNSLSDLTIPLNAVFVDGVNGDDDTAIKYELQKPFKTLTAATEHAVSGDNIFTYPDEYPEGGLGKDGVNYYFMPGVIITPPSGNIFDDLGNSITSNVFGSGRFVAGNGQVLNVNGQDSKINFNCSYAECNGGSSSTIFVRNSAENAIVFVNSETDIYQKGAGESAVRVDSPGAQVFVNAKRIIGETEVFHSASTTTTDCRVVLNALQIIYDATANGYTGFFIDGAAFVDIYGPIKIIGNGTAAIPSISIKKSGSNLLSNCIFHGDIVATGNSDGLFFNDGSAIGAVTIFKGTIISEGNITNQQGKVFLNENVSINVTNHSAVKHQAGLTVINKLCKNLWNNAAGHATETQAVGLVIGQAAVLYVTNAGADAINAVLAVNVNVYPGAVANTAKNVLVTAIVGTLTVSSSVNPE